MLFKFSVQKPLITLSRAIPCHFL